MAEWKNGHRNAALFLALGPTHRVLVPTHRMLVPTHRLWALSIREVCRSGRAHRKTGCKDVW